MSGSDAVKSNPQKTRQETGEQHYGQLGEARENIWRFYSLSISRDIEERRCSVLGSRENRQKRPTWKAVPTSPSPMGFANSIAPHMNLRLHQWYNSKEKLLAILPELGNPKLIGTSPVPVILIEGTEGMSILDSKLSNEDRTVAENDVRLSQDSHSLAIAISISNLEFYPHSPASPNINDTMTIPKPNSENEFEAAEITKQ
ncbi:hypothetical protein C8J55DRAFT_491995 [Lentinula edodes]|uniref:Uncharacterized protein n=1 Tax=Lentinula lateritia TaxID=40482 RepID=A0A9W9DGK4_9AGAR|nr:hypothetical protein C8J55DRAFT_491995 [Lentinula edodes]